MFYLSFPVVSLKAHGVERRTWCAFSEKNACKKYFWSKERSPARELACEAIVDSLNEIHSPKFQLKDKKAARERWNLLRKKLCKKMSEEAKASGISVKELTEKESDWSWSWERRYHTSKGWISMETAIQGQQDCRRYQEKSDGAPQRDQETPIQTEVSFSKTS